MHRAGEVRVSGKLDEHIPVLLDEVLASIVPVSQSLIVDCTTGLGGHSRALLAATPESVRLIGLDADEGNLSRAAENLREYGDRVRLVRGNFTEIASVVGRGVADAVLADLGVSSNQISDARRGLSFEVDGPLDMRLDQRSGPTAADLVNDLDEESLANLLYVQSQERGSRRIAKRICAARRLGRLNSTVLLARIVAEALGQSPTGRAGRIHPATRTFMALRMAVNREGESLAALLREIPGVLRCGGRAAIISFHSGEDRLVKEEFRMLSRAGSFKVVTRKPITASADEARRNPRSRTAKLRVAEKLEGRLSGGNSVE